MNLRLLLSAFVIFISAHAIALEIPINKLIEAPISKSDLIEYGYNDDKAARISSDLEEIITILKSNNQSSLIIMTEASLEESFAQLSKILPNVSNDTAIFVQLEISALVDTDEFDEE